MITSCNKILSRGGKQNKLIYLSKPLPSPSLLQLKGRKKVCGPFMANKTQPQNELQIKSSIFRRIELKKKQFLNVC